MTQAQTGPQSSEDGTSKVYFAVGLLAVLLILHELRWVLVPFVLAGLLAYLCHPLAEWISTRLRVSRLKGVTLVFLLIVSIGALAAWIGVPLLLREIRHLFTDTDKIISTFSHGVVNDGTIEVFGKRMDANMLADVITTGLRAWFGQTGRLIEFTAVGFVTLFGGVLILVLFFYLLAQGPQILQGVFWLIPARQRATVDRIWIQASPLLWRYVIGVLIVVVYAVLAAYVGLGLVLGLKHAFILALLTGILEMIPVVGPGASALIGAAVAIGNATGVAPVIGYAVYAIILRLSIDQLLGPLVLGAASTLSPVVIIFGFLAGGALFGIPGVILATPIALVIKTSVMVLRDEAQMA